MPECIVFCSGALVMILEMVGARLLAPYVGTSVIVWTSLIGVMMACLALGAWLGGRLADRVLQRRIPALLLTGAALGCTLTALGYRMVGEVVTSSGMNLYVAALVAACCLFALPACFFGMISPYMIRLRMASMATSGRVVGRLYALSTAGSILGTFLGGFVLVSWFSSSAILFGSAICLLLLSFLASFEKPLLRLALLAGIVLVFWASTSYARWRLAQNGELPPLETAYNVIQVMRGRVEGRPAMLLRTDPDMAQSGMFQDDPAELCFDYTRFYALGPELVPQAARVLMLGGGGYSVPKWLLAGRSGLDGQALRLDVVELDPGMTAAARRFFALRDDPRLRIIHEDARRFCNTAQKQYDIILVDVFNSHYAVPFHVGTLEAVRAMRRCLASDGALLMNVISAVAGEKSRLLHALYKALRENFPYVCVFSVTGADPREVQNLMLLALPRLNDRQRALLETPPDGPAGGLWRARLTDFQPDATPAMTDNFAPAERYAQALLP